LKLFQIAKGLKKRKLVTIFDEVIANTQPGKKNNFFVTTFDFQKVELITR
jgi:hypothetical protein